MSTKRLLLILALVLARGTPAHATSRDWDGTGDRAIVGTPSSLNNPSAVTLAVWMYPRTAGETSAGFLFSHDGFATGWWGWQTKSSGGKTQAIELYKDFALTALDVISSNNAYSLNAQSWTTLTWDGSVTATNAHLYVNDSETTYQTQTNGNGTKNSDASDTVELGNVTGSPRSWDGQLSMMQFFSRTLSTNELAQVKRLPGSVSQGLLGFWPLWGGSPEADYSSNHNSATLTNTTNSATAFPICGVFVLPPPGSS